MKFLLNELNKYVIIEDKTTSELIDIFTSLAFEVEDIYPASQIKGVELKLVEDCVKHPNADTLNFLHTKINGKLVDVVCGADNIKSGQIVAHAVPGSKVGDITMGPKELRGIVSNGMVVSIAEVMGVSKLFIEEPEVENILVFPKETNLNMDVSKLLELDGDVIDLSILPDRQYASSYFSMAREIAAYIGKEYNWKIPEVKRIGKTTTSIELGSKANAVFVTDVILKEGVNTPMWIKRILYHSGIKPSNNIEDVMKYSMLLTGANTYIMDKQSLIKLDDRRLNNIDIFESNSLLTKNKKVSFVTIASSKRSNFVNEKNINSYFGMRAVKGTMSEAAELTSRMVLSIATKAGFVESVSTTISQSISKTKEIKIEDSYIFNYLGQEIDLDLISEKLKLINIIKNGNKYIIPSYRKDIEFKADVIEEIVRLFGVQNIKPKPYTVTKDLIIPEVHKEALIKITDELVKYGLSEIKTYQLITEDQAKKTNIWNMNKYVQLTEDYSLEYNTLQTSLLSGMIKTFKLNYRNDKKDIRLFEIGNIFHNEKPIYSLGIIHDEFIN
ncbi:MAG: hypothetical protein HRS50_02240, partial [Mycoplasmataceae bacterium]|nr:hypothetical protein [Mycoplasmataceae bacterium]